MRILEDFVNIHLLIEQLFNILFLSLELMLYLFFRIFQGIEKLGKFKIILIFMSSYQYFY
jgi:hypothetical protein